MVFKFCSKETTLVLRGSDINFLLILAIFITDFEEKSFTLIILGVVIYYNILTIIYTLYILYFFIYIFIYSVYKIINNRDKYRKYKGSIFSTGISIFSTEKIAGLRLPIKSTFFL